MAGTTDTSTAKDQTDTKGASNNRAAVTATPTRALEDRDAAAKDDGKEAPKLQAPVAVVAGKDTSTLASRTAPPQWLNPPLNAVDWASIPNTKKMIRVYGLRLFGASFGEPINRPLATALISVQRALYDIAVKDIAGDVTESKFCEWLWKGSYVTPTIQSEPVERHRGWHDRNGASYHTSGSATDLNYNRNPWCPLRSNDYLAGENDSVAVEDAKAGVWRPCVDIYDRAMGLLKSLPKADLDVSQSDYDATSARLTPSNIAGVVAKYRAVNDAVRSYFQLAFDPDFEGITPLCSGLDAKPKELLSFDAFRNNLQKLGSIDDRPDPTEVRTRVSGQPPRRTILAKKKDVDSVGQALGNDGFAKALYEQIKKDYRTMKTGTVFDSLIQAGTGYASSSNRYRYPQHGFMNLRDELIAECVKAKLRWGGYFAGNIVTDSKTKAPVLQPSSNNGDMQHFDLGTHPTPDGETKDA